MRIVIVGGGVIALLTAVNCVAAGHEVVLADQGEIPFPGATSYDRHRVIRALHLGDPATTAAAAASHHLWIGLQRRLSASFYEQAGAMTALSDERLAAARTTLAGAGLHAQVLDPDDLAAAYPHVRFPAGAGAVLESHAGVLLADRVLTACADWLRARPNTQLLPHRRAVSVDAGGAKVRLADGEVLSGDALLLAIGPWSRELLAPDLAGQLTLKRQSMLYCEVPAAAAAAWAATPAMLSLGADGGAWLVPPVAGTPLKLSASSSCRTAPEVEDIDTAADQRDHLLDTFADVLPGFHPDWLTDTKDCYYLERTSTGGPMLAVLGERVLSYAACGGSSFKFAPLIARSLSERLTGADPAPTGLVPLEAGIVRPAATATTGAVDGR